MATSPAAAMVCACIDIGSNTTRVLVAEVAHGAIRPILERKHFTELGRDLRATGWVSEPRIEALAAVVAEYGEVARAAGARHVRTVATAAVRRAANGEEVVARVRARAGVRVDVVAGEEEARLAFLGATRTLGRTPAGTLAVLDIGGGSSEIAFGTVADGVRWSCSLEIGSSYLAEAHQRSDPPTAAELEAMRAHAADAFARADVPRPDEAVAVGGSATALCRMGGAVLDAGSLERAARLVCGAPAAAVADAHALDEARVRVLPAGILLLDAAARRLGCPLQVGRGGLREGVCLELAASPSPPEP